MGGTAGDDGRPLPRRAGVSSFGFGGTNAHVVLEEYPQPETLAAAVDEPPPQLFVLSAANKDRLREYAEALADAVETSPLSLRNIAFTLQVGREPMDERLAVVASTREELAASLRSGRGVHYGTAAPSKPQAEPLIGGHAGEVFLRALIEDGDWNRLARLWVSGMAIDLRADAARGLRPTRSAAYLSLREGSTLVACLHVFDCCARPDG